MIKEDNNGYVVFPSQKDEFNIIKGIETLIYIVVFHPDDILGKYVLSNIKIEDIEDYYLGNDIRGFVGLYPLEEKDNIISIPLTCAVCIGWSDNTYIHESENKPWVASFRDLSYEGRKLYYSMKKLHNQKEVRILTFSKIFTEGLQN
jgi:hypothetical protein